MRCRRGKNEAAARSPVLPPNHCTSSPCSDIQLPVTPPKLSTGSKLFHKEDKLKENGELKSNVTDSGHPRTCNVPPTNSACCVRGDVKDGELSAHTKAKVPGPENRYSGHHWAVPSDTAIPRHCCMLDSNEHEKQGLTPCPLASYPSLKTSPPQRQPSHLPSPSGSLHSRALPLSHTGGITRADTSCSLSFLLSIQQRTGDITVHSRYYPTCPWSWPKGDPLRPQFRHGFWTCTDITWEHVRPYPHP